MTREMVSVGEICGTRGLHGELKVLPLTDFPERFSGMEDIWVERGPRSGRYKIEFCRAYKQFLLFKFAGIDTKEEATAMVKGLLKVDEDEVFPLPEDTHYVYQLLGLEVDDLGKAGYSRELHWCSSDNDSLDGLVLPQFQIAILDGTAPHVVDPRYPGAVDEIVNLGEFWNETQLIKNKGRIIDLTQLISRYFRLAYLRLNEAYAIWNEISEYFSDTVPDTVYRYILSTLKQEIESSGILSSREKANHRHLFASAITPGGVVNHAHTLFEEDFKVLALAGSPGTGVQKLLASVMQWTEEEMIPVEAYHNCFIPSFLEMLIFRSAKTVILDASGIIVNYEPVLSKVSHGRLFDLNQEADASRILRFGWEIADSRERFDTAISGAVGFINLAKQTHDELEKFYVPAMNFNLIDKKYDEVKQRILEYIAQSQT